jgi:hypothetical protein
MMSPVLRSGLEVTLYRAGFAKLGYQPGTEFMKLFVRTCVVMELKGFAPLHLANIINGAVKGYCCL